MGPSRSAVRVVGRCGGGGLSYEASPDGLSVRTTAP